MRARPSAGLGAASIAAVGFGRIYDRVGLRGLIVLPPLAIAVPLLSFSSTTALFVLGAIVWGAGMGVHDSTMRAAVADFVPAHRRGAGYGTFTAIYGLAWLAGATVIGLLYEHGLTSVLVFVTTVQAAALLLLIPVLRGRSTLANRHRGQGTSSPGVPADRSPSGTGPTGSPVVPQQRPGSRSP